MQMPSARTVAFSQKSAALVAIKRKRILRIFARVIEKNNDLTIPRFIK